MIITALGHAGLDVRTSNARVLIDPWLSPEGAFQAAWFQYPDNSHLLTESLLRPTAIVISHEHLDHVDPWFLSHVPRDIPAIIPRPGIGIVPPLRAEPDSCYLAAHCSLPSHFHQETRMRSTAQTGALVFGIIFLLVGILGLFVDDGMSMNPDMETAGRLFGLFPVNLLHNIVHSRSVCGGSRRRAVTTRRARTARSARWSTGPWSCSPWCHQPRSA